MPKLHRTRLRRAVDALTWYLCALLIAAYVLPCIVLPLWLRDARGRRASRLDTRRD